MDSGSPKDDAESGTIAVIVVSRESAFSALFSAGSQVATVATLAEVPRDVAGVKFVALGPDIERPTEEQRIARERWGEVTFLTTAEAAFPRRIQATTPAWATMMQLSDRDRACLRTFFTFYDARRDALNGAVRQAASEVPEVARAAEVIERTEDPSLARSAIIEGDWRPYLDSLLARIAPLARAGVTYGPWLGYMQVFRTTMVEAIQGASLPEAEATGAILGAALHTDIATFALGEARRIAAQQQNTELNQFQAVVDSSSDAIITTQLDGTIASWNAGAERLYGWSAAEAIGRNIVMIVPTDRRVEVGPVSDSIGRAQRVSSFDTVRMRKDGKLVDVSVSVSPVRDASGRPHMAAVIARDITDRKKAEERFRLAVESWPNAMVIVDSEGRIVLVNAQTERLFGYDRSEMLGSSIEMLVPPRFREEHPGHRTGFVGQPTSRPMGVGRDLFGIDKSGHEFPIEVGLNPVESPEGTLVLAAIVDISARKRAEAEVQRATDELVRSNAELEQFAYVASHDLQEPLRMVASYTGLLTQRLDGRLDERELKYVGYILDGATRMQQLITDLLAYSRIGTRGNPFEPADTTGIVQQVLRVLHLTIRESGATFTLGELPTVSCDASQLNQVFQNLIGNAIKFRGETAPHIAVSAERKGTHYIFSVADNGIGIEREYAERIFQMFQRLHERGKYDGSGIGLAITKRIVERHGGRIWFESIPGEGTTFYFSIPAGTR